MILYILTFVFQPLFLRGVLRAISGESDTLFGEWPGWCVAIGFGLITLFQGILMQAAWSELALLGAKTRVIVQTYVYEKSLRLSQYAQQEQTTGNIVTLMSVDAERCVIFILFSHWFYTAPLMIIGIVILLSQELGWRVTGISMTFVAALAIAQWGSSKVLQKARKKMTKYTENRVRLINEILQGIRVIKAYAWEEAASAGVQSLP